MDPVKENSPKILIISSDTGGGHRSAAQALTEGIARFWKGESAVVRIIKAVEESHHLTRRMVNLYNWILRYRQSWMKYYFWFVNRFRPERSKFLLDKCVVFCKEQFEKYFPHIIVSVHPMTQHVFARILKELKLLDKIPLVTVVTDPCYGFWKGWACDEVSLYLVANDDARRQLIDYGVPESKIKISGMPVNPKFGPVEENAAKSTRKAYGLDEEKFTVFVNAGYVGGGNIPQIFKEFARGEIDCQAIFLAGKNEELRKEAEEIAKNAKFPIRVIGYSDEIEKIMQSADVMISKLGGLTTFEALSCHLPIIADVTTPPMPQEEGTVNLVSKRGAGILLDKTQDIVPTVKTLIDDRARYDGLKNAAKNLAVPDATRNIVNEITALIPARQESTSGNPEVAVVGTQPL